MNLGYSNLAYIEGDVPVLGLDSNLANRLKLRNSNRTQFCHGRERE
jgi:hypothetical protein